MKRVISVFLLAVFTAVCLTACAGSGVKKPATVEGSIFGGAADDAIAADVSFDAGWLTKKSGYDPGLAQFCALLSADSYFRAKDLDKGRQNRVLLAETDPADYGFTTLLDAVGFTQTEHYESYSDPAVTTDVDDSVTLTVGHLAGKYDVYAVVVRGCFSAGEWRSAFDPGCGELTGEHPDRTDPALFKGMDVAASRALAYILDYMERTGDPALPDRILITGHSRGGGIANILGAYFERESSAVPYTYTFNAPGVTLGDAGDYKTIFNVFDEGDLFVDSFPFADGGFVRYGRDMSASVAGSDELRAAIAAMKGRDDYTCVPAEAAARYRELFARRFPSRDMLGDTVSVECTFDTLEDAEAARGEYLTMTGAEAGLAIADLCSVGEVTGTADGFSFTFSYCGAALLRTYAMILAYGEAAYAPAAALFAEDADAAAIASLLLDNAVGITGGHLLINGYVLAGTLK